MSATPRPDRLQTCDIDCPALLVVYTPGGGFTVQVTAADGAVFVGWETADGIRLAGLHYAQPGETIFAVFEQP